VIEVAEDFKDKGRFVKYVRLDDSGENASIERAFKEKWLVIEFEFRGPRTLQRNEKVKIKFQTLHGRVRSMFNNAGIMNEMRCGIWAEYASTAIFYANILLNRESGKPPHESMFGVTFKKLSNLKIFGEMFVVTTRKNIQGNLSERGTMCMFVGSS
jgi:hypothetical protein